MREVCIGATYKHFKGSLYIVIAIGTHTETGEQLVVYQDLKRPELLWVRPISMFLDSVGNKYRFELIL